MKKIIRLKQRFLFLFTSLAFILSLSTVTHGTENLDDLLKQVKQDQVLKTKENLAREQTFAAKKDQQKKLLQEANGELKKEEAETARLMKIFSENEKKLAKIEEELNIATGTLGELFGVVRQTAGDLRGQFTNSVISAQIPERNKFVSRLAESKSLPDIKDLEKLWFEMQREMTESGKVARFTSEVVEPSGQQKSSQVVRVGSFNLVSEGQYLSYEADSQQVIVLPRQPASRHLSSASNLEEANSGYEGFSLDPSRGAILGMLIQSPSLGERIGQGGLIGYIILALLAFGLGLVIERLFVLKKEGEKIKQQLTATEPDTSNPLGQLMVAYRANKTNDLETLEHKLDEVILKSTPQLKRGISTIKILSAVAPLLGLLGTVTGMILTFQSITLFGTGDPKLMAGGISQALVTTVLGLVCAIPLLLLHNFVASKSKNIIQILEEQTAGMIARRAEDKA